MRTRAGIHRILGILYISPMLLHLFLFKSIEISGKPGLEEELPIDTDKRHAEVKAFTCQECGLCTKHLNSLYRHKQIHSGKTVFCGKCPGKSFYTNTDCKDHEVRL